MQELPRDEVSIFCIFCRGQKNRMPRALIRFGLLMSWSTRNAHGQLDVKRCALHSDFQESSQVGFCHFSPISLEVTGIDVLLPIPEKVQKPKARPGFNTMPAMYMMLTLLVHLFAWMEKLCSKTLAHHAKTQPATMARSIAVACTLLCRGFRPRSESCNRLGIQTSRHPVPQQPH